MNGLRIFLFLAAWLPQQWPVCNSGNSSSSQGHFFPSEVSFKDSQLTVGSAGKKSTCNAGDLGLIPGLGRSPVGVHGNLFQYSCLENPEGPRSLAGCIPWNPKELDTTEQLSTAQPKGDFIQPGEVIKASLFSFVAFSYLGFLKTKLNLQKARSTGCPVWALNLHTLEY